MKSSLKNEIHNITVRNGSSYNYMTPALLIQGKYLEKFGFGAGTKVTVECRNSKLVLTPSR